MALRLTSTADYGESLPQHVCRSATSMNDDLMLHDVRRVQWTLFATVGGVSGGWWEVCPGAALRNGRPNQAHRSRARGRHRGVCDKLSSRAPRPKRRRAASSKQQAASSDTKAGPQGHRPQAWLEAGREKLPAVKLRSGGGRVGPGFRRPMRDCTRARCGRR